MHVYVDTQDAYEAMRDYFVGLPEGTGLAKEVRGGNSTACYYRMDDPDETGLTLKCAAGSLLADELYDYKMENVNFRSLIDGEWDVAEVGTDIWEKIKAQFANVDIAFISAAQIRHDSDAKDPADFVRLLDYLADQHGLDVVMSSKKFTP